MRNVSRIWVSLGNRSLPLTYEEAFLNRATPTQNEHSIIKLQSVNKRVIGFKSCLQVVLANAASPNTFSLLNTVTSSRKSYQLPQNWTSPAYYFVIMAFVRNPILQKITSSEELCHSGLSEAKNLILLIHCELTRGQMLITRAQIRDSTLCSNTNHGKVSLSMTQFTLMQKY